MQDFMLRDWKQIESQISARGWADLGSIFLSEEVEHLIEIYPREELYRRHIQMRRHGFGQGEYKYYDYPLPDPIQKQRSALYPGLAGIANIWNERLGKAERYPDTLQAYLQQCHTHGQEKPTALILKYGKGDYNHLHQDLYGEMVFPIQVVCLLSSPDDFEGGEFVLTEQRPRMQSRVEVVPLKKGHGIAFAVNERPHKGSRGYYRLKQRHGVSTVRSGVRHTMGIIFHDAK